MSGHGLTIFASNQLETLADELSATMAADPLGPLEREVIVLQSRGMYRWLTLALASRLGIAATIATPFPGTFCRALAERIERHAAGETGFAGPAERFEPSAASPFERDVLVWRLFQLLGSDHGELVGPASFYVRNDLDQAKRFALATRLAERFDEYQLYRPDWLAEWAKGKQPIAAATYRDTASWQATLWKSLVRGAPAGELDLGNRFRAVTSFLLETEDPLPVLPRRVTVFGAPSLPPVFLDLLVALARHVSVQVHLVSPTPQYWADIRSSRDAARLLDTLGAGSAEDLHIETGHPLLASLGRQGRELGLLLHERDETGSAWQPLAFEKPPRSTVLGALQADIHDLASLDTGSERPEIDPADRSLEIHVCHSPMREMQVVRDVLLDAFASTASLRPQSVLVMAPNIETYAPYVEAVFGIVHEGEPPIPYSIADRTARAQAASVDAAFRFLELATSHATASDVLDFLECAPVRAAAGLHGDDLVRVREWIRAVNVRWGLDAEHRRLASPHSQDSFDTWRAGLDRLLLGYAVGDASAPVAGVLARGVAAQDPATLGRLAAFVRVVTAHVRDLAAPRPLERWAGDLTRAFDDLLAPVDDADEASLRRLRDSLIQIAETGARAGLDETVSLAVLRESLARAADATAGATGFLSGGVTFCSLAPMRAIPAELIVIVGLDDTAFPRRDRPVSFDLLAVSHRAGDRSPRDDDRYAFLETLLAARTRLVLTYTGRSERDNSALTPSSVLTELTAAIDRTFRGPADAKEPASKSLIREHALQPFSERYFDAAASGPATLFSFSQENCRGAMAARRAAANEAPFFQTALGHVATPRETIDLSEMVELFADPSKHFATRVIGLRLPRDAHDDQDREPFGAHKGEDYASKVTMLERRMAGHPAGTEELELLRSTHGIAHAGLGRAHYETIASDVASLAAAVRAAAGGEVAYLDPPSFDMEAPGFRIAGRFDRLTRNGLLLFRPATLKAKDRVRAWIQHVALCAWAKRSDAVPAARTVLVGTDATVHFATVENPDAILERLAARCSEAAAAPLPMFPESSFAYAEQAAKLRKEKSRASVPAFEHAATIFAREGDYGPAGEAFDPHVRLVWRGHELLGAVRDPFEELAIEFWEPVLMATSGGDATAEGAS